jgi:hypothetical protein
MASSTSMKRSTHQPDAAHTSQRSPQMLRWGGLGAVTAGVLFVAWGYLDKPNIQGPIEVTVDLLSFAVPISFTLGLLGFYAWCEGQQGPLCKTGLLLALIGTLWGASLGLLGIASEPAAALVNQWQWRHMPLAGWDTTLFCGLGLAGIAAVGKRRLGSLVLCMGVCGWIYHFTDSGAFFETRAVHVGFGLVFAVGWVVLGIGLLWGEAWRVEDRRL